MKSKKVITLSLSDLKDLGVIPRKNKKKQKKRKGKKPKYIFVDPNTGAIIGGSKSDSSHMQGYSQSFQAPQFTNTANISSAIQEENLKAIERSNRKALIENPIEGTKQAEAEQPKPDQNQLLLGYLEDRFGQIAEHNNNLFGGIAPKLERIENDNQQQKIINQQGFEMINRITNPSYYSLTDNAGIEDHSVSSDNFKDQGKPIPQETTNFQTPPKTRFDAKLSEDDNNKTPQGIPLSLLKEIRSINKLQGQYDNLLANTKAPEQNNNEPDVWEEEEEEDAGGDMFKEIKSPIKEKSPYTKQLIEKLAKKGRGNKTTKSQALHMYKGAGGNDPNILNAKHVATILSAYNKLQKNK
jgi:hypothetical protein